MTAEITDARLTDFIRVMKGGRRSLYEARERIGASQYSLGRMQTAVSRTDARCVLLAEVRTMLREAAATIAAVHDSLQRAEENLRGMK